MEQPRDRLLERIGPGPAGDDVALLALRWPPLASAGLRWPPLASAEMWIAEMWITPRADTRGDRHLGQPTSIPSATATGRHVTMGDREEGQMADELWGNRALPASGPQPTVLGRWEPANLSELTAHRRRLASALHNDRRAADIDEGAVERLLLAYEELGSNALRHGRAPVRMVLTAFDCYWLLVVSDGAADVPPLPATDRDASEGGLGLYLVARVCGAHGWTRGEDSRKHVWAQIDHTRTEVSPERFPSLPRPRRSSSRPSHDR